MMYRGLGLLDRLAQRAIERGDRARRYLHMAHLLVVNIRRTQLTRMAAALSYRTIFGLIPVMVIGLLVITMFASREQVSYVTERILDFTGFSRVVLPSSADITPPAEAPAPQTDVYGPNPIEAEVAAVKSRAEAENEIRVNEWISHQYDRIRSMPSGTIGLVGLLALAYAAISMLVEVEKAFNQIYNAPEGRSWIRRVTQYWTLLTLGSLFLVGTFYAQQRISEMAGSIAVWDSLSGMKELAVRALGFLLTVVISTAALFIIYMIVPNTRVQPMPALLGATTAAILWESGKWAFTGYVGFATGYSKIYGALAILPLFFLWIYITWLIVLLGLQLASALQMQRLTTAEPFKFSVLATFGLVDEDAVAHRVKIVDPAAVLVVVTAVAERFAAGKTSDHAAIGEKTGIDEQAIAEMLERLAGAGLLVRVADAEREGSYTLARPPEQMPAADVLAVSQELVSVRSSHTPLLDSLAHARMAAIANKSVADLMQPPAPEETTPLVRAIQA
jgi:membrane protein